MEVVLFENWRLPNECEGDDDEDKIEDPLISAAASDTGLSIGILVSV